MPRDKTGTKRFKRENSDRLLGWEFVHGFVCAGKTLYPSKIAERTGQDTADVRAELNDAKSKALTICRSVMCYNEDGE